MPVVSATDSRVDHHWRRGGRGNRRETLRDRPGDAAAALDRRAHRPGAHRGGAREPPSDDPWAAIPAPAWREGEADWVAHEDQFDASFLASGRAESDARPWEFSLEETDRRGHRRGAPRPRRCARRAPVAPVGESAGRARRAPAARQLGVPGHAHRGTARAGRLRGLRRGHGARRGAGAGGPGARRAPRPTRASARWARTRPRCSAWSRCSRWASPSTTRAPAAIGAVTVLLVIFGFIWYLSAEQQDRRARRARRDGLRLRLGRRARLLRAAAHLAPLFAHQHGLAYLFGAVALTVANDTGRAVHRARPRAPAAQRRALAQQDHRRALVGGTVVTLLVGVALLPLDEPVGPRFGPRGAVALSWSSPRWATSSSRWSSAPSG